MGTGSGNMRENLVEYGNVLHSSPWTSLSMGKCSTKTLFTDNQLNVVVCFLFNFQNGSIDHFNWLCDTSLGLSMVRRSKMKIHQKSTMGTIMDWTILLVAGNITFNHVADNRRIFISWKCRSWSLQWKQGSFERIKCLQHEKYLELNLN